MILYNITEYRVNDVTVTITPRTYGDGADTCEGGAIPTEVYDPETQPQIYPVHPCMSFQSAQTIAAQSQGYVPAVPFYPYMPITHPETISEPINFSAQSSRDPLGADLPYQGQYDRKGG